MRITRWLAVGSGVALLAGCAGLKSESKPSDTVAAQDQAHDAFQRAADAQSKAKDEQAKAEEANKKVDDLQKQLAEAQAQARGQQTKAEAAQQEATRLAQIAPQQATQLQKSASNSQKQQFDEHSQRVQSNQQSWTDQKQAEGQVLSASGGDVRLQQEGSQILQLKVNDGTAVLKDGKMAKPSDLSPGEDVRASYQLINGQPTAVRIEAKSRDAQPKQDPGMMQNSPGDQSAPDDKIPPADTGTEKNGQPGQQPLQSPNQGP